MSDSNDGIVREATEIYLKVWVDRYYMYRYLLILLFSLLRGRKVVRDLCLRTNLYPNESNHGGTHFDSKK